MSHAYFPANLLNMTSEGFNYDQTRELIGKILAGSFEQKTAADVTASRLVNCSPLLNDSGSPKLSFICPIAAGAGESVVVTVVRLRAGVSTNLTTAFTYDDTKAAGVMHELTNVAAALPLLEGDVIAVTYDYTAGATPTPITDLKTVCEPRPTTTTPNGS